MRRVRIGSVGLGRLGMRYAENLAFKIPQARLEALCDVDRVRLKETAARLGVKRTYTRFEDMVLNEELDGIVIASPSACHPSQIAMALKHGKHVFSEKPLGTSAKEGEKATEAVREHPELVFMLGFMRRFDPSYQYAKELIDAGEIGRPVLFRSYSQDPETCIKGAIAFAPHSGGEFLDMAVHDIDLARWMLKSEPESVWAIGGCYAHPEFAEFKDGDNVSCLMKFGDGAMAFLFAGRTAPHGYNVETEIIGTKATLRIASVPQKNLVEILDGGGVRRECSQDFLERFEVAYLKELQEFAACIREDRRPEVSVMDGIRVLEIAEGCRESFETGTLVKIPGNR